MNGRQVTSWRLAAILASASALTIASVVLLLLHPTAAKAGIVFGVTAFATVTLLVGQARKRVREAELAELLYLRQDLERVSAEMKDVKLYTQAVELLLQDVDASMREYLHERIMRRYQLHQRPTVLPAVDRGTPAVEAGRGGRRRRRQAQGVLLTLPIKVTPADCDRDRGSANVGGFAASAGA
jgi:hypothetical protein